MKKTLAIIVLIFLMIGIVYAVDQKLTALTELTTIADTDIIYIVDDPGGSPLSRKITVLNLFDTIDTFSELNTIVVDKTLVNEEDAVGWDALGTFNLGVTITTGDPFTLGTTRWDNASDKIDGEQIADDTIDNDSIDWGDMTDLTTDGALDADVVDEAHIADDGIDSEHYNDDSIDNAHINWGDIDNLGDEGAVTLAATVTVSDDESTDDDQEIVFTTDNATLESDGDFHYSPDTGTVTTTEFVGGGAGVTSVDAITGDSATAFFDAGTIEHEYGGLEADISSYTGLVAITGGSTAEVDSKSELEGHIADVADFAEADGDTWTGTHDLSGATVTMPKRTANDDRYFAFNAWNPNALYDTDTQICIEPNLPANITITEVTITLDADPTTELDWDLKWADAFIGLANATLIEPIDTTTGTTYIDSGFDDATVVAGKCLYIEFAADPDSNIKQAMVKIKYDYD